MVVGSASFRLSTCHLRTRVRPPSFVGHYAHSSPSCGHSLAVLSAAHTDFTSDIRSSMTAPPEISLLAKVRGPTFLKSRYSTQPMLLNGEWDRAQLLFLSRSRATVLTSAHMQTQVRIGDSLVQCIEDAGTCAIAHWSNDSALAADTRTWYISLGTRVDAT